MWQVNNKIEFYLSLGWVSFLWEYIIHREIHIEMTVYKYGKMLKISMVTLDEYFQYLNFFLSRKEILQLSFCKANLTLY